MATRIVFSASHGEGLLSVDVEEDLNGVFDAWTSGGAGMPFALTKTGTGEEKVWINPATVAYWEEAVPSSAHFP